MSGAVHLLPHYAFVAWIRQLSFIQDSTVVGSNKPYELGNEKDYHSDTGTIMKRTRYIVTQRDVSKFLERFIN